MGNEDYKTVEWVSYDFKFCRVIEGVNCDYPEELIIEALKAINRTNKSVVKAAKILSIPTEVLFDWSEQYAISLIPDKTLETKTAIGFREICII